MGNGKKAKKLKLSSKKIMSRSLIQLKKVLKNEMFINRIVFINITLTLYF